MDSYGFTCKGALSPYARRTRHSHEEDQAQRAGAATRRTKLRWLPLRGSRDRKSTQVMRRRSSVEGVDTTQEAQGCQAGEAPEQYSMKKLGTININVMMTPRSGVSVDDDEVDGVSDEIGDVGDNEVDGVGDKVGGVNTSVQCVDLMLEVIPGPQWTTAFGSIYIRTANLLWAPSDVR
ncbi:hypothetical protein NDA12_001424 [Ustilago hordei]|nr:hypothetical protein NDA15_004018 [Ustilago hordei]KAJ1571738.1 hypothetical protein NDA12_001424 [Ustilago hordei]